jgi:hypothetical protein
MTSIPVVETLVRDARYAARGMRKSPGFTSAAVLTLALAIGINTAVFSIVDAVLLRPLPYPRPETLALVSRIVGSSGLESGNTSVDGRTWLAVRDHAPSVDSAVFSSWTTGVNLIVPGATASGQARYVQQQRVGAGFFRTLGIQPQIGREFTADEDRSGGPAATILSAELWRGLFGGDPAIVGSTIMLRGAPYTVVGVMPDGFHSGERAELWTPLRPGTTGEGSEANYQVLLRLHDNATRAQVDHDLARVSDVVRQGPSGQSAADVSFSLVPLQKGMSEALRQPLLMLWAAVGVVLLVACVNLAGLLLARGSQRT